MQCNTIQYNTKQYTEVLEGFGALTPTHTIYIIYLELEINFLEATLSKDRERAGFSLKLCYITSLFTT